MSRPCWALLLKGVCYGFVVKLSHSLHKCKSGWLWVVTHFEMGYQEFRYY